MKVGLLDVDNCGKIKKWGSQIYPNIALCKIARYHKERGDSVEWAVSFMHYDILYRSKIFNYTQDDLTYYSANQVIRGVRVTMLQVGCLMRLIACSPIIPSIPTFRAIPHTGS